MSFINRYANKARSLAITRDQLWLDIQLSANQFFPSLTSVAIKVYSLEENVITNVKPSQEMSPEMEKATHLFQLLLVVPNAKSRSREAATKSQ